MPLGELIAPGFFEPLRRSPPRLLLLVAPAGYGKTAVARALASNVAGAVVLDNPGADADFGRMLHQALGARPGAPAIACSRRPVVIPTAFALPHEMRLVRADELRFSRAAVRRLFEPCGATDAEVERLYEATFGWPAAVLVARNRARESGAAAAVDELERLANRPLEQYLREVAIASLSEEARSLLLLASFKPLCFGDGEAFLGDRYPTALDEVEESFLIRHGDGTYRLHPLIKTAIALHFQPAARAIASALGRAYESGAHPLLAAHWYVRAGDAAAANAAYSQQTLARMIAISGEDAAAAAALDERELIDNLAIFNVAAIEQLYARDCERWLAMAEEALRRAPAAIPAEVRGLAIFALVSRSAYFGRVDDAQRILNEQRALLGNAAEYELFFGLCDAFVRVARDEFVDLAELRRRFSPLLLDPYGRAAFASVAAYAYAVQGDWRASRVEWEVMVDGLDASKQEMHLAEALMSAIFFAWLNGDDERSRTWLQRLSSTRAVAGAAFFLDCVRGTNPTAEGSETAQVRTYGYLIAAAAQSDAGAARYFARCALADARRTGRPFFAVLANLALGILGSEDARACIDAALALAAEIPSPELQAAAAAVATGAENAGMLRAFRARFARERCAGGLLSVDVLHGTIEWDGRALTLNERPRQVVIALALAGAPLRGEDLASRVWPDRNPAQMQNALRVHLATIRKAAGPSAVVYEDGCYRLTKSHVIDLDTGTALVRQAMRDGSPAFETRKKLEALALAIDRRVRLWDCFEWFAPVERRIDSLRRTALVTLAEDALRRREPGEALRCANLLIECDACDEGALSIAVRAHVLAGRVPEAVREYRNYRRALQSELGVDFVPDGEDEETLETLVENALNGRNAAAPIR